MDDLVTHAEVMRWLSRALARELELALSPDLRGWYTEAEAEADGGRFVETRRMQDREGRYYKVG